MGFVVTGPFLGTAIYNSLSNFTFIISSTNWLIISTVSLIILMILVSRLGVFSVEHFSNWRYYEELENIDSENIAFIKDLESKNGMIIFSVCLVVFGVAVTLPLGDLYITTSIMIFWGMYMVSGALTTIGIMGYWFYQRQKKLRKLMISQIELRENNNN
ncbi:MAG: hypothetical protein ACI31W_06785 [Lactococcus sp.]